MPAPVGSMRDRFGGAATFRGDDVRSFHWGATLSLLKSFNPTRSKDRSLFPTEDDFKKLKSKGLEVNRVEARFSAASALRTCCSSMRISSISIS